MIGTTIDELDGRILQYLSTNCRMSYNSLGNEIGLTAKSIKARVKKMQVNGIIDSFLAKVNPVVFGYSKICLLVYNMNSSTASSDLDHIKRSINLLGDILYTGKILGNISTFKFAVKKEEEEKIDLLLDVIRRDALILNQTSILPSVREPPNYIDFKIMRCLLDNPRMEISDISEKISFSSKTVARRLGKMIENRILDFTLQFDFTSMRGYIVSVVSAQIEKGYYTKVLEKSYSDIKDSLCIYSPMLSQEDVIYWLFFSKDVFALDSILKRMESYSGVRKTNIFIPISIEYHKEVIIKKIERILADKREGSSWTKEITNAFG